MGRSWRAWMNPFSLKMLRHQAWERRLWHFESKNRSRAKSRFGRPSVHPRRGRAGQSLAGTRKRGTGRRARVAPAPGRARASPHRRTRAGRGRERPWRGHRAAPGRPVARRARCRATLGVAQGGAPHPVPRQCPPHRTQALPMLSFYPSWTCSPHDHPCALGQAENAASRPPPPSAPGGTTTAVASGRRAPAARPIPEQARGRTDGCDPRPPSAGP